jgi:hypothetical protein
VLGDFARERCNPLNTLGLGAELGVKHDMLQRRQALREARVVEVVVGVEEEGGWVVGDIGHWAAAVGCLWAVVGAKRHILERMAVVMAVAKELFHDPDIFGQGQASSRERKCGFWLYFFGPGW